MRDAPAITGPDAPLVVVGMRREAAIVGEAALVAIGAADLARRLADPVGGVLSFGLCGALDPALAAGDLIIGLGVVSPGDRWNADAAWVDRLALAFPAARRGWFAGGAAIIASSADKARLRQTMQAAAVDMESEAAARAAQAAVVPFAILRAVSDSAVHTLPKAATVGFRPDGAVAIGAVLAALAADPGQLPALIRTARGAWAAFHALETAWRTRQAWLSP